MALLLVSAVPITGAASSVPAPSASNNAPDVTDRGELRVATASDIVTNQGDRLRFDLDGPTGLNPNARYTFGDPGAPSAASPLTVTNTGDGAQQLSIAYALDGVDPSNADNLKVHLHDEAGSRLATVTESRMATLGLQPGASVYAVVIVDSGDLSPGDDLDGTLQLQLSEF